MNSLGPLFIAGVAIVIIVLIVWLTMRPEQFASSEFNHPPDYSPIPEPKHALFGDEYLYTNSPEMSLQLNSLNLPPHFKSH